MYESRALMPETPRIPRYLAFGELYSTKPVILSTYDHRTLKIRLPVRSAIYKQCTGGLVVRWVTTSESPLLYVFAEKVFLFAHHSPRGRTA